MAPVAGEDDLKKLVQEYINQNKVMVFSKSTCGFCTKVIQTAGPSFETSIVLAAGSGSNAVCAKTSFLPRCLLFGL